MKKFPAVLLCGLAAMVLTVVLYFTILGNFVLTTIHIITLVAILLAEAITTGYACAAKGNPRRVAAAFVSSVMIPFAVILSVVYIINFPFGYATYVGWYCAGMLVINVLAFILMRFDSNKSAENARLQSSKGNMLALRKIVKCIMADPAAQTHADRLRKLEEKLHFSNDSVISTEDENIRLMLLQLQQNVANPAFDAAQLMDRIEKSIDVRNIMVSRNV